MPGTPHPIVAWADAHPYWVAILLGALSSAAASIILHRYFYRDERRCSR
jgi:hypothetical protein